MSSLYEDSHRALHKQFDSERIASALEEMDTDIIEEPNKMFIESRDFFFLATVDSEGRPQAQYKGGKPGFVKVVDEKTLAFPSYDGNGRYHSMGNIGATSKIGMMFLDFETPNRLRVQGEATVSADDPLMSEFHEAELVVRVKVTDTIGIVGFVDAGNAYEDSVPDFSESLKVGVGAGLRYFTPIGPLRIDAAVPLDPGQDDPDFALYVGLSQAF